MSRKFCLKFLGMYRNADAMVRSLLGPDRTGRVRGCFVCLDAQHATRSAFKRIKVGQVAKSRLCLSEPHGLSAAWAKRWLWGAGHHVVGPPNVAPLVDELFWRTRGERFVTTSRPEEFPPSQIQRPEWRNERRRNLLIAWQSHSLRNG
jgi:hypothetical protein